MKRSGILKMVLIFFTVGFLSACWEENTEPPEIECNCDDENSCTVDSCDADGECIYTPQDSVCDDEIACTTGTCDPEEGCVYEAVDELCADDGVDCTTERCDLERGCVNDTVDSFCDDENDCTIDTCFQGVGCRSEADNSACDDQISCTVDSCDMENGCVYEASDSLCDDRIPCTEDSCDQTEGCVQEPIQALCNDGVFCTEDICDTEQGCVHETNNGVCDDGVDCTNDRCDLERDCVSERDDSKCDDEIDCTIDRCDTEQGCLVTENNSLCDDNIDCTSDICAQGVGCLLFNNDNQCPDGQICRVDEGCYEPPLCDGNDDLMCDDGQECTSERCDPETGRCTYEANDEYCNDGQFCTGVEACVPFRGCVLRSVPVCNDDNNCTVDQCNEEEDKCEYRPDNTRCDDGHFCNGLEQCDPEGGCVPGVAPSCDDGQDCTNDSCNDDLNRCVHEADHSSCDDQVSCTIDRCDAEEGCVNEAENSLCEDGILCTEGMCDLEDGCKQEPIHDLCNDGVFCTENMCDIEQGCLYETNDSLCDDGVDCTNDRCDLERDCISEGDDSQCDDEIGCTVDRCDAEQGCLSTGNNLLCDDNIECTSDICSEGVGCLSFSNNSQCPDGQICRVDEGCYEPPLCDGEDDPRCDDGQECTSERCDPETGRCIYEANDDFCDDGQFCTGVEACAPFRGCVLSSIPVCDDNHNCTIDQCNEEEDECEYIPENSRCNDGHYCNGLEQCDPDGGCVSGTPPTCDDGQECTNDSCNDDQNRCVYEADNSVCDDGLWCTGEEICLPGQGCVLQSIPQCDDNIPCTVDQCNEDEDQCDYIAEDGLCNDGLFCNGVETCNPEGGCEEGSTPSCDDEDDCTTDSCNSGLNRCVSPIRDQDDDGDPDALCGGGDCNDNNPEIYTGKEEECNGEDDNCDGMIDEGTLNDCGECGPTPEEICDEVDNNCDGEIDEGVLGECGDCDMTCHRVDVGTDIDNFDDGVHIGTEFDGEGLTVSAETRISNNLWVPNTAESTFSRWDADTATEVGRYLVGLPAGECNGRCCWDNGCNMPSRVAVDGLGNAYVANRGFAMQGTVSKVLENHDECPDLNENGMVDTSTDNQPLPWGEDECIVYHAPVGPSNAVLRALAIDMGDLAFPEGYPWVGAYNSRKFWKLRPDTGEVLLEVDVPVQPYGAVVTADGMLWIGTLSEGAIASINTNTGEVSSRITYPVSMRPGNCAQSYGITADSQGRIWLAGWGCNDALGYDPSTGEWTRVDTTPYGMTAGRGITVAVDGRVWMALGGDGASNVAIWNMNDFAAGGNIPSSSVEVVPLPSGHNGPSGIGADLNGFIWVAHHATSQLVRIDPDNTETMDSYTGPNRIYTYTDFTGAVRRTVSKRGTYQREFDGGCEAPIWEELSWDVTVPEGNLITFSINLSDTQEGLDEAEPIQVATVPDARSPIHIGEFLAGEGIESRRFMRLSLTLEASEEGSSPVARSYNIQWRCNSVQGDPDCGDGVDNDQDGITDFPHDRGCESAEDHTEWAEGVLDCVGGGDYDHDGEVDEDGDCSAGEPEVACSEDLTINTLEEVTLEAMADDDNWIDAIYWEVEEAPFGSVWQPSDPYSESTNFQPPIPGDYLLTFHAIDDIGQESTCSIAIHATLEDNFRVELFWNPELEEDNSDMDLHLLHHTASAWFEEPGDCYYSNTNPTWDGSEETSPHLDLDDTSGWGPENINIGNPAPNQPYRVGVHYYSDSGMGPAEVFVRVYCFDEATLFGPVTMNGPDSGQDSNNDFWKVADITFGDHDCTVEDLSIDGEPNIIPSSASNSER